MHIVLFSPSWPPGKYANGIVTYCKFMRQALIKNGHKVTIISGDIDLKQDDGYVSLIESDEDNNYGNKLSTKFIDRLNPGYITAYLHARKIQRTLLDIHNKKKIDIFECEESFGWCKYFDKNLPFPIVLRLHGPHFINGQFHRHTRVDRVRIAREGVALKQAKYVSSPSKYVLEKTKKYYSLTTEVIADIPNPIDLMPKEMSWNKNDTEQSSILFVGRFDLHKGGDVAIRTFARILKSVPDALLYFAGPDVGIKEDNKIIHIEEYIKNIIPPQNRQQIKYLGKTNPENLISLRKKCSVTIFCSRDENFPYTGLEALSAGSPFIASNVGGVSELFRGQDHDVLYSSEDIAALAEKVCTIIESVELQDRLSVRNRNIVETDFTGKVVAKKMESFYQDVIDNEQFKTR